MSFLNANGFNDALNRLTDETLLVIEADAIVEVDYTGAKILGDAIGRLARAAASPSRWRGSNRCARRGALRVTG